MFIDKLHRYDRALPVLCRIARTPASNAKVTILKDLVPRMGVIVLSVQSGVMVESGVRVRQGFEGGGGLAENVACLE